MTANEKWDLRKMYNPDLTVQKEIEYTQEKIAKGWNEFLKSQAIWTYSQIQTWQEQRKDLLAYLSYLNYLSRFEKNINDRML
jgi:hypothetical protein